ncbi:hypothetical protein DFO66_10437 [Brevibacterium sanguinis]|uniref:PRC-barrel domain protein n=2 Tax=Brevibacterium TaxID=1696 RepID=A0A366IKH8_9MICO|nr:MULTISPECIES: PRC-barrel domain-containing protein [Brevibacterium]RBP65454.1 hypothetical protein DFO66_10437 [Brevibacterium sanguinis]RBP72088.1 hypothetical protein DFO65_10443 [Brevibacterium celere]
MILSELFDAEVVDATGARLGWVLDLRFRRGTPGSTDSRLEALIVGGHRRVPFLGYERAGMNRPWIFAHFLHRIHRDSLLIPWSEVARYDPGRLTLRADHASEPLMDPGSGDVRRTQGRIEQRTRRDPGAGPEPRKPGTAGGESM